MPFVLVAFVARLCRLAPALVLQVSCRLVHVTASLQLLQLATLDFGEFAASLLGFGRLPACPFTIYNFGAVRCL